MQEPDVLVPVTCPACGVESLCRLPVATVAEALIQHHGVMLRTACHPQEWQASSTEMHQIREYLGAACIDRHDAQHAPHDARLTAGSRNSAD